MTKTQGTSELRRRAEARLKKITSVAPPLTEAESQQLIHELQVHQIELELQNEELMQTRAQLEQSLEKYTDLYDFAPISYFLLAADGAIQELNLAGAALLGQARSRLIGRRFGLFLPVASRPAFTDFLGKVLTGEAREVCEITLALDGLPLRYLQLEGVSKGSGADRQCRIAAMDITERKQVELLLIYQQIVNSSPDALSLVSADYRYQIVNDGYRRNTGLLPEQIVGQTVATVMGQTVFDQTIKPRLDRCLAGETVTYAEWFDYPRQNRRYLEVTYSPCHDARHAAIIGAVVVSRDITDRKQAEEAIRESAQFKQAILDAMTSRIAVLDREGNIIAVNQAWLQFAVQNSREGTWPSLHTGIGVNYLDICRTACGDTANGALAVYEGIKSVLAGTAASFTHEYPCHSPDQQFWFSVTATVLQVNNGGIVVAHTDITPTRRLTEDLRQSEERLRRTSRAGRIGLYEWNASRDIAHWSAEAYVLFGLEPHSLANYQRWIGCVHPDDREGITRNLAEILTQDHTASPDVSHQYEYRVVHGDGTVLWLEAMTAFDRNGDDLIMRGAVRDITERKQAEIALRASAERLRLGMQVAGLGLAEIDYRTQLNRLTAEAARLFGLGEASITAPRATVHATFHPEDRPLLMQRIEESLDPAGPGWFAMDHRVVWPDGQVRWLRVRKQVFFYGEGSARQPVRAILAAFDVTAKKNAEAALLAKEAELRLIADMTPVVLARLSRDLRYVFVNRACAELYHRPRKEFIGKPIVEMMGKEAFDRIRPYVEKVLRGEQVQYETEIPYPHIGSRFMHIEYVPERNAQGEVVGWIASVQDFTERKKVEEALRESEARLQALFHSAIDAILVANDAGQYVDANPAACGLLGYPSDELLRLSVWDVTPACYRDLARSLWQEFGAQGNQSGEYTLLRKDGAERIVEYRAVTHFYPGLHVSILRDITERKQMDEQLRQSQERLAWVLAITGVGLWMNDMPLSNLNWDDQTRRLFFLPPSVEPTLELFWSRLHPDDREPTRLAVEAAIRDHALYEMDHRAVDPVTGEVRWIHSAGQAAYAEDGMPVRFDGVNYDITPRKQAEEALRESEERLRLFIRHAPSALAMFDRTMRYLYASNRWLSDYGLGNRDLQGLSHYDVFPEISAEWKEIHRRGLAGEVLRSEADRFERMDGSVQWVRWEVRPWRYFNQSIGGIVIFAEEITERIQAEELLKAERDRFEKIVATVPGMIASFRLRPDGSASLPYASPAIQDLYGLRPEEVAESAAPLWAMMHPDDLADIAASIAASAQSMTPWRDEFRVRHPAKGEVWIEGRSMPVREPDGSILWHGYLQDITERRQKEATIIQMNQKLEQRVEHRTAELSYTVTLLKREMELRRDQQEQLLQARKLEAIGQLTGGIAHDFNNLLTVIKANLEILREKIGNRLDADDQLSIQDALSAARDGAELTSSLLTFSRRQPLQWRSVNVNSMVQGLKRLLSRSMGPAITLMIETDPKIPAILTDPGTLQSSLMNLVLDARDAMPKGGTITLNTATVEVFGEGAASADLVPGRYVVITVTDSGIGMDATTLSRVTEPFFTTKRPGMGTGLGLSIVHGFATQSGGRLNIQSQPGLGTRVRLLLPATRPELAPPPQNAPSVIPQGVETILVVEDRSSVRRVVHRYLRDLGYSVLEAGNVQEAIEILETEPDLDLVFSDIVMPGGKSGYDLANWLAAHRPSVKCLLTTGYSENASGLSGVDLPPVLAKPYSKEQLAQRIRQLLDQIAR